MRRPFPPTALLALGLLLTACGAAAGPGDGHAEPPAEVASTGAAVEGSSSSRPAENATNISLDFLAASQREDGGWAEPEDDGRSDGAADPEVTGIVVYAFLAGGYTNRGKHAYARRVQGGLRQLKRHLAEAELPSLPAILAMVEAYAMTYSPIFRSSSQRGLDHLSGRAADGSLRDVGDVGWALLTLMSVRAINHDARIRGDTEPLVLAEDAFRHLAGWADLPPSPTPREVAVAALARLLFDPDDVVEARLEELAPGVAAYPKVWRDRPIDADPVAALFGAHAVRYMGKHVYAWQKAAGAIVERSRGGRYDPADLPRYDGGPLRLTALSDIAVGMRHLPYSMEDVRAGVR